MSVVLRAQWAGLQAPEKAQVVPYKACKAGENKIFSLDLGYFPGPSIFPLCVVGSFLVSVVAFHSSSLSSQHTK